MATGASAAKEISALLHPLLGAGSLFSSEVSEFPDCTPLCPP